MAVLMINGSIHEKGCTYTALQEVAAGLLESGIDSEIVWLGQEPVKPCVACGGCNSNSRCAYGHTDGINALIEKLIAADALVLGSPVHYAGIVGSLKSTLDRMFFAAGSSYAYKPAAAVVSARRAGTTTALEQLNKYFLYAQMLLVGSTYWAMVHGQSPEDVAQDLEGLQTAHRIGQNTAWLLKTLDAGKAAGIEPAKLEPKPWTNFIR